MAFVSGSAVSYVGEPMVTYPPYQPVPVVSRSSQSYASCPADLHAQITPIHTLPYDILYDIFNLFTFPVPEVPSLSVAFTLSQVCHSWRKVALTSPKLWADLTIRIPWSRCHPDLISWVKELVSRSNQCLLFLQLHIDPFSVGVALSLILANSQRIRKLSICIIVNSLDQSQWDYSVDMPLLEHFSLSVADSMFLNVSMVPNADHCSFHIPPRVHRIKSDACSLRNLTSLSLKNLPDTRRSPLTPCDLRTVLRLSRTSLRHLEIYDGGVNLAHSSVPLSLPHLQSLSIGYLDPGIGISDLNQFIKMLTLPNLRTLSLWDLRRFPTLSYPVPTSDLHVSPSTDILAGLRRFNTVTHLHMIGVSCGSVSSAMALVRSYSKLRSLSLIKCDSNFMLPLLHVPSHNMPSPPTGSLLEDLALCTIRPMDLVTFLERRSASKIPQLRSLTITPQCLHKDFMLQCRQKWWGAVRSAEFIICSLARHVDVLRIARQPLDGYTIIDQYVLARKAEGYRIGTESLEWVLAALYKDTHGAGCMCMSTRDYW